MIDLKKLYTEHPECFQDSAKFRAYLTDLYPGEKKARINVLVTLLSEGVLTPAQTKDKFDDMAFCKRISDDYGYNSNLVKECFAYFAGIFDGNIVINVSPDIAEQEEDRNHLALKGIVRKYGRFVMFDAETSGLDAGRDEIIEFGAVVFTVNKQGNLLAERHGFYIKHNQRLSDQIVGLTGITDSILREKGLDRQTAEKKIVDILYQSKGVIGAYNTQFDLSFVYALLKKQGKTNLLNTCCYLDAMTIYKDRAVYPHKLVNAMQTYGVVQARMHDARDDAFSAASVLSKMIEEKDDIEKYLNLFGYNPKYGVNGEKLSVIYYAAQPFTSRQPLYELNNNLSYAQKFVETTERKNQTMVVEERKEKIERPISNKLKHKRYGIGTVNWSLTVLDRGILFVDFFLIGKARFDYPACMGSELQQVDEDADASASVKIDSTRPKISRQYEDDTDDADYYEAERQREYEEEYLPEYSIKDDDPDYPDYYWEDLDD